MVNSSKSLPLMHRWILIEFLGTNFSSSAIAAFYTPVSRFTKKSNISDGQKKTNYEIKCWFCKFGNIFSYLPPHRMSIYQFCFFVQRYCCILFLWNVKWWIDRNPCPLMHSAAFYTPVSHFTKIKSNRIVGQKKILITTWNVAVYVDRKIPPPKKTGIYRKNRFSRLGLNRKRRERKLWF